MVVKLNRLAVVVFLATSSACVANDSRHLGEPALDLASKNFELAKNNLEKRIDECELKKVTVPASAFKAVTLTEKELKVALLVLHNRVEDACDEKARGRFVLAASIYRITAKHYQKTATSALPYSEDMLFGHYWQRLESEAEYLQMNIKQRALLESIPQLKKPFRLFDTLSQLNIR